jgi:hypothetical protein
MSTSITRRGTLAAAATISLLVALGTASQASAATYYACVKKSGTAHIYTKKPKCKRGESKLSWNNVGRAGKNGISGTNGKNGANGLNGANGAQGIPGPFLEALPSGRTETGVYALEGDGSVIQAGFGFTFPLVSAPVAHFIADKASPSTECPGSVSNPRATPGSLCVYEGTSHKNASVEGPFNPENESFAGPVSRFGFGFNINNVKAGENAWSQGTWAVTAL